jgi:polynucleotide 5'-kinase involved in rRNA processing
VVKEEPKQKEINPKEVINLRKANLKEVNPKEVKNINILHNFPFRSV